ncbi:hypothetical protein LR48_Vigan02g201000 [Vigna angularis]|uniref:Uncharacterized protein n=2 Tax=Phaseolus angularis TaxID=3914 RepID=A0A0L9TZ86_PHAAN|nr:uncharacterized protein LOC108325768 [Vigna angularis]KAG2401672.1 uncharacterized protein HKW66_Vig0192920 [Vigna angularis]KOM35860.1 hypothetical protein LR48_Vigan02g201000 [Vigna angularis]BAT94333.1 hypothetical protein VIGAN_08093000 [Vigna angularis var. angularis]
MSSSTRCFVVALCLVMISYSPMAAKGEQGLAEQICMESFEDKEGCLALLKQADPKIVSAKSFQDLAEATLEWAVSKGSEGQAFLKELAQVDNSPAIVQCANFDYDGVVESFKSALGELKDDPETASYDAKVAGDGPDCCDRGLASANINNPAIAALNRQILLLSSLAFNAVSKCGD